MRRDYIIYTLLSILLLSMTFGNKVEAKELWKHITTSIRDEVKEETGQFKEGVDNIVDTVVGIADVTQDAFIVVGDVAVDIAADNMEFFSTLIKVAATNPKTGSNPADGFLDGWESIVDSYENITYREGKTTFDEVMRMSIGKAGLSDVVSIVADKQITKVFSKIIDNKETQQKFVDKFGKAYTVISIYNGVKDMGEILMSDDPDKGLQFLLSLGDTVVEAGGMKTNQWISKVDDKNIINSMKAYKYAGSFILNVNANCWGYLMKTEEYKKFVEKHKNDYWQALGKATVDGWGKCMDGLSDEIGRIAHGIASFFREEEEYKDLTLWERFMCQAKPSSQVNVYKPNIYFYSDKPLNINVEFLAKHLLTKTIPEYSLGWETYVYGNGKITCQKEEFDFLFYESLASRELAQKECGWVIYADTREEQLLDILAEYDFNEKETLDFMEFWMEMLEKDVDYIMYPQNTEDVDIQMPIRITPTPEKITRIWYGFEKYQGQAVEEAEIVPIVREGFTVVEWGGFFLD